MNDQRGHIAVDLVIALIGLAGVVGWIMNIIDIANSEFTPITTMLVLRFIGVFVPPLGAVLGYI